MKTEDGQEQKPNENQSLLDISGRKSRNPITNKKSFLYPTKPSFRYLILFLLSVMCVGCYYRYVVFNIFSNLIQVLTKFHRSNIILSPIST